jgi:hypothetical protein
LPHTQSRFYFTLTKDYYVEIDVVMDANTPLWKAHDLSQQLQDKLEVLPNVGRAFVHVDHETTHTPVESLFTFHSFGYVDFLFPSNHVLHQL